MAVAKGEWGRGGAGGGPCHWGPSGELAVAPGFTPGLAQAVVEYRDQFGPLAKLSELIWVLGMSKSDYALAKKAVTLG